ncbi:hypothetical protein GDO81_010287 [Engystomops pustulosus]|uniref:Uncharacterized protein n=1 Tax=Engystomops pustulosus TaxID=76066 RepID=A0AAV7BZX2_ENGPU|nr:hypothetical protein GDO81_010287 [Engystomops pustulosus]
MGCRAQPSHLEEHFHSNLHLTNLGLSTPGMASVSCTTKCAVRNWQNIVHGFRHHTGLGEWNAPSDINCCQLLIWQLQVTLLGKRHIFTCLENRKHYILIQPQT